MVDTIPAPLRGKVAVVTGGSRGIGAGIAHKFVEHGCSHIALTYLSNKEKAEDVLISLRRINPNLSTCAIGGDVMDPDFGSKVVKGALAGLKTDHIDIAVSSAAYMDLNDFPAAVDITKQKWDEIMTAEAWAPLSLAKEVIQHMPPCGRIIMLSSVNAKLASGDPFLAYSAGKAALDATSRNLAAAWAVKYGVTVNTIGVGTTKTEALTAASSVLGPALETGAKGASLLKRIGEVDDVANIVAFVASPQAQWIVGNQIPANGGMLAMLQS
ncbi:hypothetical protein LTR37_013904 [Vermiconidia calcicola]|uniref:Uncharacterized protein n=1 Tax=Vermiconidia calcicola TaxID=1690605 RepID=A0ACC3MXZ1_9PEZI|nr:hypothetical protein LTR37_013904 [Vermiconidia calcicola]